MPVTVNAAPAVSPGELSPIDLSLDLPELNAIAPASLGHAPMAPAAEEGLDFDMSGLSLDLNNPAAPAASDNMATKLALAREFIAIGDKDSARSMAQEVAQHATGTLQAQAEALLQSIR